MRVPYEGAPSLASSSQPLAPQEIRTTPNSFGAGVAEAAGNLGDNLAKHAFAFQGMQNEATARDANNQFGAEAGKLWEEYRSNEGQNAVAKYPKFQADMAELRQSFLKSMPNPEASKMFDTAASGYMRYMLEGGARYAGDQNRAWQAASHKATEAQAQDNAVLNRDDPRMVQAQIASGEDSARQYARQHGLDETASNAIAADYRSRTYKKVISALAIDNPDKAQAYFNSLKAGKDASGLSAINGDEQIAIQQDIEQSRRAHQAQQEHNVIMADKARRDNDRKISTQLFDGIVSGKAGQAEIMASDLPAFGENSKQQLIGVLKSQSAPETDAKKSHGLSADLLDRIHAPEGAPDKITEVAQLYPFFKDMTRTDYDYVQKQFLDAQTPEGSRLSSVKSRFLKAMEPLIAPKDMFGVPAPQSKAENWFPFQQFVDDKIAWFRSQGKDPNDLFNPQSKDYLGTPESIALYKLDFPAVIKAFTESTRAVSAPTVPAAAPPKITSDAEYESLAPGTTFIDPTGKQRIKPK